MPAYLGAHASCNPYMVLLSSIPHHSYASSAVQTVAREKLLAGDQPRLLKAG